MNLNVVRLGLPGAAFSCANALAKFEVDAELYESVIAAYRADGDEDALAIELTELGFDQAEIREHLVRPPGWRMKCGYIHGSRRRRLIGS